MQAWIVFPNLEFHVETKGGTVKVHIKGAEWRCGSELHRLHVGHTTHGQWGQGHRQHDTPLLFLHLVQGPQVEYMRKRHEERIERNPDTMAVDD